MPKNEDRSEYFKEYYKKKKAEKEEAEKFNNNNLTLVKPAKPEAVKIKSVKKSKTKKSSRTAKTVENVESQDDMENVDSQDVKYVESTDVENVESQGLESVDVEYIPVKDVENVENGRVESLVYSHFERFEYTSSPIENVESENVENVDSQDVKNVESANVVNVESQGVESHSVFNLSLAATKDYLTPTGIMYLLTTFIFLYFSLAGIQGQGVDSYLTQILIDLSFIYSWSVFCDKYAYIMRFIISATLLYSISFAPLKTIHNEYAKISDANTSKDGITQEAKDKLVTTAQKLYDKRAKDLNNIDITKAEMNKSLVMLSISYNKDVAIMKKKKYPYPESLDKFKVKKIEINNLKNEIKGLKNKINDNLKSAKSELDNAINQIIRSATQKDVEAAHKIYWDEGTNIMRRLIIFLSLIWFSVRLHRRDT